MIKKNESLISIKKEIEKQKEELGSRFPNRNYEKIIKLIDKSISNEDDWKIFEHNFDRANRYFFRKLKESYPQLTQSDLRLCAYLQMNLTSKEVAQLMNISVRGVESHRYRLRKRLDIPSDKNLFEFISTFAT